MNVDSIELIIKMNIYVVHWLMHSNYYKQNMMLIINYNSKSVNLTNSNHHWHTVVTALHSILAIVIGLFVRLRSWTMKVPTGPALSMFEVFSRTAPQIFWRAAILDPNIPYKLSCQFEWLWYLDYGANTNAATRCVLWAYNTAKKTSADGAPPRTCCGSFPESLADFKGDALQFMGMEKGAMEGRGRERSGGAEMEERIGRESGAGPPIG